MDTVSLVRQAAPTNLPPLARGYIVPTRPAPASLAEGVYVVLPEGSTEHLYGPCKYGALHGSAKPQPGAACVVGFDEQNQPTILWWEGTFAGGGGGTEYFAGEGLELKNIGGKETFLVKALAITEGMLGAKVVSEGKLAAAVVARFVPTGGAANEVLLWKASGEGQWGLIKSASVEAHGLTVDRLKEGELTNAYIKAAAGIEESKLSLPEVVIKTTEQTITGRKTFQQSGGNAVKPVLFESVTPPESEGGVTGGAAVEFKIANGNVSSLTAATPAAGGGGQFSIATGTGGTTTKATSTQKGGAGGSYAVTTGGGGQPPAVEAAVKAVAGEGGSFQATTGAGGGTSGAALATGTLTSGNGGTMKFATGKGGSAIAAAGLPTAGSGGLIEFKTGAGGQAEASEVAKPKAGSGGTLKLETGEGASAVGTEPVHGSGGKLQVILGNGGNVEEAKSGTFTIYYNKAEATKARFEVGSTGLIKIQKSIGLWEHAPPEAKPESIKPEAIEVKVAMERIDKVFKEYGITT